MARLFFLILSLSCWTTFLNAAQLKNGPMIGYAAMAEVLLWAQTDSPAEVRMVYWEAGFPEKIQQTDPVFTRKEEGFIAKCIADEVRPGKTYGYSVLIDGEQVTPEFRGEYRAGAIPLSFSTPPNWRFRESGHDPFDFTVAFGSCAYINEREGGYDRMNSAPYGADYQIFESIYETQPDFFIWLGDNIYYREPDWSTRTGMIHRWTNSRAIPELRPLLATVPQYAIWDDHDYGPNDAGREFWNKELATEIFTLFNGNPTAGVPGIPGIFTYFAWGDVHFYLLDNRTHRTVAGLNPAPFGHERQQFGKEQIDWLIELLKYNRNQARSSYPANFHVIATGSQVISPHGRDTLRQCPEEWRYLFERLVAEEIHNVIFLTGDVHFSEVSRLTIDLDPADQAAPRQINFWDITASPLTAGPWDGPPREENPFRVDIFPGPADRYGSRNFATLTFEGPLTRRRAVIRYFDSNGNLLNQDPDGRKGEIAPEGMIPSVHANLDPRLFSEP